MQVPAANNQRVGTEQSDPQGHHGKAHKPEAVTNTTCKTDRSQTRILQGPSRPRRRHMDTTASHSIRSTVYAQQDRRDALERPAVASCSSPHEIKKISTPPEGALRLLKAKLSRKRVTNRVEEDTAAAPHELMDQLPPPHQHPSRPKPKPSSSIRVVEVRPAQEDNQRETNNIQEQPHQQLPQQTKLWDPPQQEMEDVKPNNTTAKTQLAMKWSCTVCQRECIAIREESRCLCGHRYKQHPVERPTNDKSTKPFQPFACRDAKCGCNKFFYVVAEGAWVLRCRCKHQHVQHDASTPPFRCQKPQCNKTCLGFESPWVCNCDHPWTSHKQEMVEKRVMSLLERMRQQMECTELNQVQRTNLLEQPLAL